MTKTAVITSKAQKDESSRYGRVVGRFVDFPGTLVAAHVEDSRYMFTLWCMARVRETLFLPQSEV